MKQKTLFLFIALVFILFTCKKDEDKDNEFPPQTGFNETCSPASYPGLDITIDGDIEPELDPMSPNFASYVACVQNCTQTQPNNPLCMMDCLNILGAIPAGAPFGLEITITNTSAENITYIVEPGDWFEPGGGDYQSMMSPITITQVVTPGETITITIPVYCLHQERSAPDEDSDYTLCEMISSSGCLADILTILETKDLTSLTYAQALDVQENIWACTNGTAIDWDYLNNLPDL